MSRVKVLIAIMCLCVMSSAKGQSAPASSLAGSEAFSDVKVLNNFCWELLSIERPEGLREEMSISVPIDRWVFIRSHAEAPAGNHEARITVDSDPQPAIVHRKTGDLEAMRYLKAGTHILRVRIHGEARVTSILVRAIPELQHALYGESCRIHPYGLYGWEFLKKDVLPNVNVMVSNRHVAPDAAHIGAWKSQGRSWINDASAAWHLLERREDGALHYKGTRQEAADAIYDFWMTSTLGVRHPLIDGLMLDEMIGSNAPVYGAYLDAAKKLYENPQFKGKVVDLYSAGSALRSDDTGKELVRFCVDRGASIAVEWYLQEAPTRQAAQAAIDKVFAPRTRQWEKALPGITPRLVAALASETAPPENGDRYPHADFKVFMDMQMRELATHPALFGLGGVQWYKSGYCDEEILRWGGRLYRHYCIEGNTEPLTKDPYELSHVRNPDFADGTEGWEIRSAKPDSVQPKSCKGYGVLQGRWGTGMGDTVLWTKRSADRPNVFTQDIKNLEPGRLYSMKMITSDYQNLFKGESEKKQDAVSIEIENVELLTEPDKSFQLTYTHNPGGSWTPMEKEIRDKFSLEHPYWLNYHRRIFRAKAPTAKLTVTDWQSESSPGGPPDQELMFNFIQIQPYFE